MSRRARQHRLADGPPAIELLEEAIHLVRGAPVAALAIYALGAVPWVGGFLYFWARMAWFAPDGAERAWAALLLAGAFVWLKVAQADFAARLYARRTGAAPAPFTWRRARLLAGAQLRVQAWGLFVLPFAALATVPFGWAFAFYQNVTVLGATPGDPARLRRESRELARLWPKQNHVLGAYVSAFGLVVWLNLLSSAYLLPWMANRFLGVENFFALQGFAAFNTTFLAIVTALTWLALDPLVKAIYVLRVFHGRAQSTGEDLREEFARATARSGAAARPVRAAAVGVALLGLLAASPWNAASARAAESTPPPVEAVVPVTAAPPAAKVAPGDLDRALDDTLRGRDFQWSLRPLPGPKSAEERGAVLQFFDKLADWTKEFFRSIGRALGRVLAWIEDLFGLKKGPKTPLPAGGPGWGWGAGAAQAVMYVLLCAVVLALLWVVWTVWRSARRIPAAVAATAGSAPVVPDLRDESLTAAQLPSDGWLALAREQIAAGDWRLAWRALYLATLARHADAGLIALAKHKTNLDYERELARRALARAELVAGFRVRRRGFEDVWYGEAAAAETPVREWLRELESAPSAAAPAAPPPEAAR